MRAPNSFPIPGSNQLGTRSASRSCPLKLLKVKTKEAGGVRRTLGEPKVGSSKSQISASISTLSAIAHVNNQASNAYIYEREKERGKKGEQRLREREREGTYTCVSAALVRVGRWTPRDTAPRCSAFHETHRRTYIYTRNFNLLTILATSLRGPFFSS